MHELALCQAMMTQVESIAREHRASRVTSITLGVGPLAGVEAQLLRHAYPVASAGTVAEGAELVIEATPVRVHCGRCNEDSDALVNRLVCGRCGDWRTELVSGDELMLVSVELDKAHPSSPEGKLH